MKQNLKRKSKGFTLIELMIAVVIIGVLFGIAIPYYKVYVIKTKITKGYASLEHYRTVITEYIAENGDFSGVQGGSWLSEAEVNSNFGIDTDRYRNLSGNERYLLRGWTSSPNRFYMYAYMYNRNWRKFAPDSPTIITYWATRSNATQAFKFKCHYYTHGKGWDHNSGRKYVPNDCKS